MPARAGIERARRQARSLVKRYCVTAPHHIAIEEFAFRIGVTIVEASLTGAVAQLVNPRWGRPRILLSDRVRELEVRRFVIAHELGHYVLRHPSPSVAEMCDPLARRNRRKNDTIEAEANAFASELLMPEALVRPACAGAPASLDAVLRIARAFRVSVRASAIRFTELSNAACAAVLSEHGVVRWSVRSATFQMSIVPDKPVDPRSIASAYFMDKASIARPRRVPTAAWVESAPDGSMIEHSILCHDRDAVLTMLFSPISKKSRYKQ